MARLAPALRDAVRAAAPRAALTVDGEPCGLEVEIAISLRQRSIGLLGRREVAQSLLLHPCSSVHSIGMLVDLEVAYLDRELGVLEVVTLPRWRMHLPRRGAVAVLEAAPGRLTACGLVRGARLGLTSC